MVSDEETCSAMHDFPALRQTKTKHALAITIELRGTRSGECQPSFESAQRLDKVLHPHIFKGTRMFWNTFDAMAMKTRNIFLLPTRMFFLFGGSDQLMATTSNPTRNHQPDIETLKNLTCLKNFKEPGHERFEERRRSRNTTSPKKATDKGTWGTEVQQWRIQHDPGQTKLEDDRNWEGTRYTMMPWHQEETLRESGAPLSRHVPLLLDPMDSPSWDPHMLQEELKLPTAAPWTLARTHLIFEGLIGW